MDTFGLTDAQKAYFDIETPAERDFRMQQVQQAAYNNAMQASGISYNSNAYGGGGGFVNSEGNAPGASPGEVGNASFSGEVGYDQ